MSNAIRQLREAKGWKQRELAEATHTCQTIVSELERGVRKPWLRIARKLARALGTSIEELFPDEFKR